jgi:hypothetical protein
MNGTQNAACRMPDTGRKQLAEAAAYRHPGPAFPVGRSGLSGGAALDLDPARRRRPAEHQVVERERA